MTTRIHHLLCGTLNVPPYPRVVCHGLLLEDARGLALIDPGIGLVDVRDPLGRVGAELIAQAGFLFHEADTAIRGIERLGFDPADVRHIVLTHADPDHAGGLADFPHATVHVAAEERAAVERGHLRYLPIQFAHQPRWRTYDDGRTESWFGLPARPITWDLTARVMLTPLFGHTRGHCGVAIEQAGRWFLHVGDAYYLRAELTQDDHPVSQLAAFRAEDNAQRLTSLAHLRRLATRHADAIDMCGYHDTAEFPDNV
jgi:glyoxylase-like metal-dependent hydrolase (beta-lactamase superfamily II)